MNQPTITRDFKDIKHLDLKTHYGNIELIGHAHAYVRVEVFASVRSLLTLYWIPEQVESLEIDDNLLKMSVLNDTLTVFSKPDYFNPLFWFNYQKTSLRVYVPASVQSVSKTYSGTISLQKMVGSHVFNTWGGGLMIQESLGKLQGKTMGGNISLNGNQGEITTNTMGGNIQVLKHKGIIKTKTWGGNVRVADMNGDFECNTMGGNIRLRNMSGNVGASTQGGNITAELRHIHQYAWLNSSGGKIKVAFPFDNPTDLEVMGSKVSGAMLPNFTGNISYNSIRGKLGGGGPTLSIKNKFGNVKLRNSSENATSQVLDFEGFNTPIVSKTPAYLPENNLTSIPKASNGLFLDRILPFLKEGIIALLFCILLIYGLNAVIYFTAQFINSTGVQAVISKGIFYQNLNNGIGTMITVYIFINLFEFRIKSNVLKYITLAGITLAFVGFFNLIVVWLYWQNLDNNTGTQAKSTDIFLYSLMPSVVACAYFFYWQNNRQTARKISDQEYQLLNLEKLKSKAQLDALEARINPHFLYNSLNSIAGLIHEQPNKAEEMTIQLSKLFRHSTGRSEENFHTIEEELEIVKAYLSIEQVRFGNRLSYVIDCKPATLPIKIPRFLVQPIVENAIKHGISKITHDGRIEVNISQREARVCISVHDNGPAFGEALGGGFGLRSTKDKLKIVYGEKASFDIQNEPQKAITISFPQ